MNGDLIVRLQQERTNLEAQLSEEKFKARCLEDEVFTLEIQDAIDETFDLGMLGRLLPDRSLYIEHEEPHKRRFVQEALETAKRTQCHPKNPKSFDPVKTGPSASPKKRSKPTTKRSPGKSR